MIELRERDGGIAVITMQHGKANALDTAFCDKIAETFHALRAAPARAVIITGQGRMFSAGVNLTMLLEGGAPYVRAFLPALHRLYDAVFNFPKPVVAAVNGHAIAGGCVLACAADRRLMARETGTMGITELRVGVPFPALALEVMRFATVPRFLPEVLLGAGTYPPQRAVERGWIDEIVEPADLLDHAIVAAKALAEISPPAFALSKRQLHQDALDRLAREGKQIDELAMEIWCADATFHVIRGYVAKTLKK
ncbi:MAG TPA: enoyl-CoA hydratase/isomerase family protein [Pseudolabrys sp.]|nr:enoyl-CoA hydratase/isomerase family protein [Pseudolabrys sp.]